MSEIFFFVYNYVSKKNIRWLEDRNEIKVWKFEKKTLWKVHKN